MEWRKEHKAPDIPDWIELAMKSQNGENPDPTNVDSKTWNDIKLLVDTLNKGSTYIHGLTKNGQPIIWIRTCRKAWYADADSESNMLILLLDSAIRQGMAEIGGGDGTNDGVTDFVIISHSYKPPPPHPKAVYKMLSGLVKGYPDRMNVLISAPVSSIVEFIMSLLIPLMPGRLAEKFVFLSMDHVKDRLDEFLLNGISDLPTFLGGTNDDHDKYYPEEKNCPTRGGLVKFDYYGMVERLKEQKIAYEQRKHVSFVTTSGASATGDAIVVGNGGDTTMDGVVAEVLDVTVPPLTPGMNGDGGNNANSNGHGSYLQADDLETKKLV